MALWKCYNIRLFNMKIAILVIARASRPNKQHEAKPSIYPFGLLITHTKAFLLSPWNHRVTVSQSWFCLDRVHPVVFSGSSPVVLPNFSSNFKKICQIYPPRLASQHQSPSKWFAKCCAPGSLLSGARTCNTNEHNRDEKKRFVLRLLVSAFLEPQYGL
jgi:hypothetical protein